MNALLEKAFQRVAGLPEDAQETIASLILEEIEAERGWEARFAASQDQLGELARAARAEVAEDGALPYDLPMRTPDSRPPSKGHGSGRASVTTEGLRPITIS